MKFRESIQPMLPAHRPETPAAGYDLFPSFGLPPGQIQLGFEAIAERLPADGLVLIDGFGGVLWPDFQQRLGAALRTRSVAVEWIDVDRALRSPEEIETIVAPFLGGDDPLFGTRFTGELGDFFDPQKVDLLRSQQTAGLTIVYGCGAFLIDKLAVRIYVDVPKNEVQYRSRAGSITNLGTSVPTDPKGMYKRFYFVDWVALNRHRTKHLPAVNLIVDGQRPDTPACMAGDDFRAALKQMTQSPVRARPWFEPGPWGGQWIKDRIDALPKDVPNYAWSFELIAPENGIVFESSGALLEVSFDFLMAQESRAVLGNCAERFGQEFPIRFDFLDTIDGGNLSVQCHPRVDYIRRHFGETFTQDETYYILDAVPGASVYLGFTEQADASEFRTALTKSAAESVEIDVQKFVQNFPAKKHDLFLIPAGTVHCSGRGTMVLEISATPYIFTFKVYDWLRLGLDGKPRSLNIDRAFENFNFAMRGPRVEAELVCQPRLLSESPGLRVVHLPTHASQFFDVHRLEFQEQISVTTDGSCHVLSLVEGESVEVHTPSAPPKRFAYAETFIIPAAAKEYRIVNRGTQPAKVIKAFVKKDHDGTTKI